MTAGVGTPYWIAPEVLAGQRYTEKSDIYSFGVLLSEIDMGEMPYRGDCSVDSDEPLQVSIWALVVHCGRSFLLTAQIKLPVLARHVWMGTRISGPAQVK
ncbi:TPA: hypothetical protein N0F65_007356 [Lagenidium giganteum]|uniref:Protein kinase domain-containing protein n=1 Tax=Lagenidium giganteum TaxID=4803 RepID=A0AAV2YIC9_9STRA|nr:TPA: hypothetical protein N0F65_007356 [Lagenidium giganteum]